MKTFVVLLVGIVIGCAAMFYRDDASVRSATNSHLDQAIGSAAASAHQALAPKAASK